MDAMHQCRASCDCINEVALNSSRIYLGMPMGHVAHEALIQMSVKTTVTTGYKCCILKHPPPQLKAGAILRGYPYCRLSLVGIPQDSHQITVSLLVLS